MAIGNSGSIARRRPGIGMGLELYPVRLALLNTVRFRVEIPMRSSVLPTSATTAPMIALRSWRLVQRRKQMIHTKVVICL